MKSFLAGLVAFILIGLLAYNALQKRGIIDLQPEVSPSPSPVANNWDMEPEVSPDPALSAPSTSPSPSPEATNSTKGGQILGEATPAPKTTASTTSTTTTKTTVTKVDRFSVLETNKCQLDLTVYIKDISTPLTLKYDLKSDMSAVISAWKTEGETVLQRTQVQGSGVLLQYNSSSDLKLRVESNDCENTSDNWFKLWAER